MKPRRAQSAWPRPPKARITIWKSGDRWKARVIAPDGLVIIRRSRNRKLVALLAEAESIRAQQRTPEYRELLSIIRERKASPRAATKATA